jgi:hypothetical protein
MSLLHALHTSHTGPEHLKSEPGDPLSATLRWFVRLAAGLLILTAMAKLYSVVSNSAPIMGKFDPLLGIRNRSLLESVKLFELLCGTLLVSRIDLGRKLILLNFCGAGFLSYRLLRRVLRGKFSYCSCLGGMADLFRISEKTASDILLATALIMFFVGLWGYIALTSQDSHFQLREGGRALGPS